MDLINLILYGTIGINIIWLFVILPLIYFSLKDYDLSTEGNLLLCCFNLFIAFLFTLASFIGIKWDIWSL